MVGRPYYAPKRGIYINDFTAQSKKLIKESFVSGKHKGMTKCLIFFCCFNGVCNQCFLKDRRLHSFFKNGITLNSSTKILSFFHKMLQILRSKLFLRNGFPFFITHKAGRSDLLALIYEG